MVRNYLFSIDLLTSLILNYRRVLNERQINVSPRQRYRRDSTIGLLTVMILSVI